MANENFILFFIKLTISAIIVGFLAGILELYIGHRFILDPLLYGKDLGFVYESYLFPTYYGLTKSIAVAITFFLVFLFTFNKGISPVIKSIIVGVLGTALFGLYYYITFPRSSLFSDTAIGIVHLIFIAGTTYLYTQIIKFK